MTAVNDLKVKLFADGADKAGMLEMYRKPFVKGFTTNPTLMRKAGITDYRGFAREILEAIPDRPISFEVFSDEFDEMNRQAREIATWGGNVYVKVPITNTRREPAYDLVRSLSQDGVKVNVTAMMTLDQVRMVAAAPSRRRVHCIAQGAQHAGDVPERGMLGAPLRQRTQRFALEVHNQSIPAGDQDLA